MISASTANSRTGRPNMAGGSRSEFEPSKVLRRRPGSSSGRREARQLQERDTRIRTAVRYASRQKITKILACRPLAMAGVGGGFLYDGHHGLTDSCRGYDPDHKRLSRPTRR